MTNYILGICTGAICGWFVLTAELGHAFNCNIWWMS